jgi:sulfur carrier protein
MKIVVNGAPLEVSADTLEALLGELDYCRDQVATALNGDFIRAKERASRRLAPEDRVEILTPRQGG